MKQNPGLWLLLGVVLANCCGCDVIYRLLQREGAEEKDLIGEIVPTVSNPEVEMVQKLLRLYGYHAGRPDGKMGPQTRSAIGQFQEDHGLKVNNFIDNATWIHLTVFVESGLVSDGEVNIRTAQTALQNAGFDPGAIDGKLGPQTQRALRAFQKASGLKTDGKIGFNTLTKLDECLPPTAPAP